MFVCNMIDLRKKTRKSVAPCPILSAYAIPGGSPGLACERLVEFYIYFASKTMSYGHGQS